MVATETLRPVPRRMGEEFVVRGEVGRPRPGVQWQLSDDQESITITVQPGGYLIWEHAPDRCGRGVFREVTVVSADATEAEDFFESLPVR